MQQCFGFTDFNVHYFRSNLLHNYNTLYEDNLYLSLVKQTGVNNVTPVFYALHRLPACPRVHSKILILTFNCIQGLAPSYLSDLISKIIQLVLAS